MSSNVFQQIKQKVDLETHISKMCSDANIFKSGNTLRVNPCPLCDANDSFSIDSKTPDLFHCFACGDGGDIFNFVEKIEGVGRKESLELLAEEYDVQIDKKPATNKSQNKLQVVLRAAVDHYKTQLQSNKLALEWLTHDKPKGRGHTELTVKRLEIGFTDGNLAANLLKNGVSEEDLKRSGLYVEDKKNEGIWKDYFCKDMIIFPHFLPSGDIAHFTIKDPNKKINYQFPAAHRLGEFQWSNQKSITANELFLVEGENDLASNFDIGFYNTLAGIGQISDKQINWLDKNATGKHIHCWFDNDNKWKDEIKPPAGIKYTRKIYQRLLKNADCTVDVVSALMADGEDPDDFIQKDKDTAKKRLEEIVRHAQHPLVWEISVMPETIKSNMDSALRYLEDIDFFVNFGLVADVKRAPIFNALESIGFSRDDVSGAISEQRALRDMCDELRDSADFTVQRTERFQRKFAGHVWSFFKQHGKFFVSPGDKLHLFYRHVIYSIGDNTPWRALLNIDAGLNNTTALAKYTNEELKAMCYAHGDRIDSFSWIHRQGTGEETALYFNLSDPLNRILKLKSNSVEMIDNGTNADKVLLSESENIKPFVFSETVNVQSAMDKLRRLVLSSQTCAPSQAYFVITHALSSFLLPLSKSKVLLKLEGGSQSAKTSSARVCGTLLYGKDMVGSMTTSSAYSMAGQEPWLIFDNIENKDIDRGFLNFLLLVATGATKFKRTSGTESGVTGETLNSLAVITGIEPFTKPELINRTFIIKYDRNKYGDIGFNEDKVGDEIIAHRDEIISAFIKILADKVLPKLAEADEYLKYIRTQHNDHSKSRMDSHLSLLTLILSALLEYMPLTGSLAEKCGQRLPEYFLLDSWINYQNSRAKETESGTNSILQLLDGLRYLFIQEFQKHDKECADNHWTLDDSETTVVIPLLKIEVTRTRKKTTGDDIVSYSFLCSTKQLLFLFQRFAKEQGIRIDFQTSMQLGVRMKNDMHVMETNGWTFERKTVTRGERFNLYVWQS